MSAFTLTIGSVSFTLVPGGDFGQVLQSLDFGQTARADVPRLASVRSDSPRTFAFNARIRADTKDEAIALVSAANRALSVSNTMIVHSRDAAQSVTFRTFPSGSVKQPPEPTWESDNWQVVQITVTVEPYAYGDEIDDVHTTLAPTTLTLEDMPGDYSAPLAVELEVINAPDKLHSVYLALNEHPEWYGWITPASGLTWTNASAAISDSTAYGGYHKYTANGSRAVTQFETSTVPAGDYIVLVRAKMGGAATGTVDVAGATRWTVAIPNSTVWRYYEVADLSLPYSIVRGLVGSLMEIGLTSSSASDHLYIDQVILLPYRAGYCSWHPPDTLDSAGYWYEGVFFDSSGAVYLDDVCHLEHATGSPIKSLSGELIMLCDEKDGDTNHTDLTVTLTQTPRYSLYR